MQVYAVTCERDHRLAMQAFSPQLRLLGFGLTKGVEQPRAFPSRHARLYLLCLFSLTVLCKHSEEFHSDFFFLDENSSTVGLCCCVVMHQECVDLCSESFNSPSVPTDRKRKKKNTRISICRQK